MANLKCAGCGFRAKYDANPKSILGRLWRWHANWCPGWRAYMKTLPGDEKERLIRNYRLKPEKFEGA